MMIPITILNSEKLNIKTCVLIDSRAKGVNFIDHAFALKSEIELLLLKKKIPVHNTDGTKNIAR